MSKLQELFKKYGPLSSQSYSHDRFLSNRLGKRPCGAWRILCVASSPGNNVCMCSEGVMG